MRCTRARTITWSFLSAYATLINANVCVCVRTKVWRQSLSRTILLVVSHSLSLSLSLVCRDRKIDTFLKRWEMAADRREEIDRSTEIPRDDELSDRDMRNFFGIAI